MSKTTDALDWAWNAGWTAAFAQLPIDVATDDARKDAPGSRLSPSDQSAQALADVLVQQQPGTPDERYQAGYQSGVEQGYESGRAAAAQDKDEYLSERSNTAWNDALDYARDEILEHFDKLVSIYTKASGPETGKAAVMYAVDARVAELKR